MGFWGFGVLGIPWRILKVCNRQVVALNSPNKCRKGQGVAPANTAGISSIWSRVKLIKRAAVGAKVAPICLRQFDPLSRVRKH